MKNPLAIRIKTVIMLVINKLWQFRQNQMSPATDRQYAGPVR